MAQSAIQGAAAQITEDLTRRSRSSRRKRGSGWRDAGRPGRRMTETLIQKHKHIQIMWCLCFGISVSVNRASAVPPATATFLLCGLSVSA